MRHASLLLLAVLLLPVRAAAQSDEEWLSGEEGSAEEPGTATGGEALPVPVEGEGDEAAPGDEDEGWLEGKEVKEVEAPVEDTTYTLKELPKKWYYGLGGRSRFVGVPGPEIEWFPVEKAPSVLGHVSGIEAVFRRDGLSIVPFVAFSQMVGKGAFQEDGDPLTDVEYWDINLKLLMIGVEFFGSVTIKDWVQYYYGAGIAFFFRLGDNDMVRNEAYNDNGKWKPCDGPAVSAPYPGGDPAYCEATGGHYDNNWPGWKANPFYIPYITLIPLGFRFKPVPNLYITFDAGLVLPVVPTTGIRVGYLF